VSEQGGAFLHHHHCWNKDPNTGIRLYVCYIPTGTICMYDTHAASLYRLDSVDSKVNRRERTSQQQQQQQQQQHQQQNDNSYILPCRNKKATTTK